MIFILSMSLLASTSLYSVNGYCGLGSLLHPVKAFKEHKEIKARQKQAKEDYVDARVKQLLDARHSGNVRSHMAGAIERNNTAEYAHAREHYQIWANSHKISMKNASKKEEGLMEAYDTKRKPRINTGDADKDYARNKRQDEKLQAKYTEHNKRINKLDERARKKLESIYGKSDVNTQKFLRDEQTIERKEREEQARAVSF